MNRYHAQNGKNIAKSVDQNPFAMTTPPIQVKANNKFTKLLLVPIGIVVLMLGFLGLVNGLFLIGGKFIFIYNQFDSFEFLPFH